MQNTCDILITNANLVIPKEGIIKKDILIENQKIKAITNSTNNISYSKKINANEKYVLPGLIDPHIHYGVFSPIEQASRNRISICCNRRSHYNNANDKTKRII